jgi:hypothetical protein
MFRITKVRHFNKTYHKKVYILYNHTRRNLYKTSRIRRFQFLFSAIFDQNIGVYLYLETLHTLC